MQDLKFIEGAKQSISPEAARSLSTTTNTPPMMPLLTPRWLLHFLPWVNVESGTYRINRVRVYSDIRRIRLTEDKQVVAEILSNIPLFSKMSKDSLEDLVTQFKHTRVKEGQRLVKEGSPKPRFYIVIDGRIDISIGDYKGEEVVVRTVCEGDYFGEVSLFEGNISQISAYAITDSEFLEIDQQTFNKILKDPETKAQIKAHYDVLKNDIKQIRMGESHSPLLVSDTGEAKMASGFSDYEQPQEINLSMIQTSIGINTHLNDIYNVPYNQLEQQIRLTVENIQEREEWEILNNRNFGLANLVANNMRLKTRAGVPTPDDFDNLLALVWKKPSFFIAHPKAISAFGRECTFRGVPPVIAEIHGAKFMTWRGIPLLPSDKMQVHYNNDCATTSILLMRAGETDQGVIGLHKAELGSNGLPSLTVNFMGVNEYSVAQYLITKYFSVAILVPDALGMLTDVKLNSYHHYE